MFEQLLERLLQCGYEYCLEPVLEHGLNESYKIKGSIVNTCQSVLPMIVFGVRKFSAIMQRTLPPPIVSIVDTGTGIN